MRNALRSRLAAGQRSINGWLSLPSGYSAEIMARHGWHSLTVDMQHGVQDYASMVQCFQAISGFPATPMVRVPTNEPGIIGKALDAGAWGVICPMVNSAEEASAFVSACRYPPAGRRSNGPNRAAGYAETQPYQAFANDEVLALPMIETSEAVESLESILDVPGVDGVYVGPTDLAFSLGLPPVFDTDNPELLSIYRRIVEETRKRGRFAAIHTMDPVYAARMLDIGFGLVTVGGDAVFIAKGARATADALKSAIG
ncbi:HpcH/HpaI aldolase family protein [Bosea sp. (in: a-proteobacteria)]